MQNYIPCATGILPLRYRQDGSIKSAVDRWNLVVRGQLLAMRSDIKNRVAQREGGGVKAEGAGPRQVQLADEIQGMVLS